MPTLIRKPRSVKPVAGSCRLSVQPGHREWISLGGDVGARDRLTLTINGTPYAVIPLQPHPEVAGKAVRLRKPDGTAYDVALTEYGATCTCPDFIFARDGKDPKGCKHVAACKACRLL